MKGIIKVILFILYTFCVSVTFSQTLTPSVVSTGGSNISSPNLLYSFTIGQIAVPSFSNGNILTQGFQQPVIIKAEDFKNKEKESLQICVNPNPVKDFINLTITSKEEISDIQLSVYDILGKKYKVDFEIYFSDNFSQISIPVENFKPGQYLISTTINNQYSKSIKILKIN
jgi:hypothetical protein